MSEADRVARLAAEIAEENKLRDIAAEWSQEPPYFDKCPDCGATQSECASCHECFKCGPSRCPRILAVCRDCCICPDH